MKKLGIIVMAFAMLLGMSQCKKENTSASNDEVVKVPITLNVNGNSGSRVAVTTETGVVTFENGDVIHVVSNSVYVGTMTYNGTVFSGEIMEPTEGQKLQFYFLGNKTPEFNADNTECSVVISDQTDYLPVISYAPSRENYQIGKTDYNATLLNKCALVKFDVTTASEAATCIVGMNNKVTVNLATNEFAYDMDGEGIITLAAGNGEKWGILLPQDEVNHTNAYSNDGAFSGSCATIPEIAENDYLINGIAIAIGLPGGAIDGLFSVSATQQVYFSQGNLQYIGSAATPYWKFADYQWDYFGDNGQVGDDENIDRDLFGWGTSGYDHGAVCYQPWHVSTNDNDFYAYGDWQKNLYDETGQADWGYNAIANGGNQQNSGWRTLTWPEWNYVLSTRSTACGIRWAKGTVNGIRGLILLPDNWNVSTYALNSTNSGNANFTSNTVTASDWTNILEANGAVFLPAAGCGYNNSLSYVGDIGFYWSATYSTEEYSFFMVCQSNGLAVYDYYGHRRNRYSVRLVRNAE